MGCGCGFRGVGGSLGVEVEVVAKRGIGSLPAVPGVGGGQDKDSHHRGQKGGVGR